MAPPFVRAAALDDAAAIAALQARSWRAAYRGLVPTEFLDELSDHSWLERWREWLSVPSGTDGLHRLVSTAGPHGPPVAIAAFGRAADPPDEVTGQLFAIYAEPAMWGRGHGSALLREVHARLADDGHRWASLWTAAGNERAIAIYAHHGWLPDGLTKQDQVAGVLIDQIRMTRRL